MLKDIKTGLLKGSLITSVGQIISVALLFLSTAIIARFVHPEELGKFFIVLSVSALMEVIISFGLEPTLVRVIATADSIDKKEIFNKLLFIRIISLLIISLLFIFIFYLLRNAFLEWYHYGYYIVCLFNVSSLRNFFNAELQANKNFKSLISVQIFQTTAKVFSYIILGFNKQLTLNILLLIEIFSLAIGFIIQLNHLKKNIDIKLNLDLKFSKQIFLFALPLYFNSFLHVFQARINNFLIAAFSNLHQVANYEIARKIPDGFSRLSASLTLVYYPFISELLYQNRYNETEFLLTKYLKALFSILSPIIFIFFIFKEEIILIIFSSSYIHVSFATFLLLIIYLFSFVSSLMGYTLVAAGKPSYSFNVNLIRTVIGFILSMPLIYFGGYIGAVYSLLLSNILSFIISHYYLQKIKLRIRVWDILGSFILIICVISIIQFTNNYYSRSFSINVIILLVFLILYTIFEREFRERIILSWKLFMKNLKRFTL